MDDNQTYSQNTKSKMDYFLAIFAICIIAVSATYVFNTFNENSKENAEINQWTNSIDELQEYGGTIYYGTSSSLKINIKDAVDVPSPSYKSSTNVSSSGTYDYEIDHTKAGIKVTYKSFYCSSTYVSSHNYSVTTTYESHSITIPFDEIRSIVVSHEITNK